jgi:hypothetical protein
LHQAAAASGQRHKSTTANEKPTEAARHARYNASNPIKDSSMLAAGLW